jgi:spore maturation protein CgeB
MNLALVFNDSPRYWTVGSFVKRALSQQNDVSIVAHPRIPEDTGILEESNKLDIDLILLIDSSTHYKVHHHKGKLGKAKTCFWISDLHRQDWSVWRLQMIKEFKFDHVFYAQKNFKEKVMACGYTENECSFLPHATDPEIFKPMPWITKKFDMGFVGYTNPKRDRIINIVKEYMRFKHFDSVWELNAARSMAECKMILNVPVEDDVCNMRLFESMSCQIPLLTENVKNNGLEDLFEPDMYLAYSNDAELKEFAVRLIANREYREQMALKARKHVLAHHTYRNRINSILGTMGFPLLNNYV